MLFSKTKPIKLTEKAPPNPSTERSEIRTAYISDIKDILKLMLDLKKLGYVPYLNDSTKITDLSIMKDILWHAIIDRNPVFVAVNNKGLTGFIFGRVVDSIWSAENKVLENYGFFAATKRVGHNLLVKYLETAEDMKRHGIIKCYIMTEMLGVSPDYTRFNMRPIERRWIS